ncbi:hypothetical protein [Aliiglaciecola sp. NS0011-25]|uniref:hypothetical protein n=1 Tax=Aliiglaciecola sp. NS0011-25 TaxID=3127654 RepID=UPI003104B6D1
MTKGNAKKEVLSIIVEHWIIVSTVFAAISIGIGLFYSSSYFKFFGIEYLHFAHFLDVIKMLFLSKSFFLALFLFSISFGLLILLAGKNEAKTEVKKVKGIWHKIIGTFFTILGTPVAFFVFISPFISPAQDAKAVLRGDTAHFKVLYNSVKREIKCANIIGTSDSNYIFWDFANSSTIIVPKPQIIEIKLVFKELAKAKGGDEPDELIKRSKERLNTINDYCQTD